MTISIENKTANASTQALIFENSRLKKNVTKLAASCFENIAQMKIGTGSPPLSKHKQSII